MPDRLRIAICEDNNEDAVYLTDRIARSSIPASCNLFPSGEALMRVFERGKWDLVFLNVFTQGGMTGIETARALRAVDQQVVIAFTASGEEHAMEGYRVNALKYIIKPVESKDVYEAMELARMKTRFSQRFITIVTDGQRVEVLHDDILYIESLDHATVFHTDDMDYPTDIKMEQVEVLLQSPTFLRCHRSYIVNLNRVREVDRDFVMENGDIVYIRGKDLKGMRDAWEAYLQGREARP